MQDLTQWHQRRAVEKFCASAFFTQHGRHAETVPRPHRAATSTSESQRNEIDKTHSFKDAASVSPVETKIVVSLSDAKFNRMHAPQSHSRRVRLVFCFQISAMRRISVKKDQAKASSTKKEVTTFVVRRCQFRNSQEDKVARGKTKPQKRTDGICAVDENFGCNYGRS